jgi:cytochrome c biogenesis protein CcmG/thiol:disulfide interchange protein DsbE
MLILLSACSQTSALETGDAAPDFTLKGIDGKNVTLSELKGKVVILDFFASWCPPCKQEIPDFIKLQDEYGSKGFVMIGVSLVNEQETKNFAEQYGINYPVVVDDGKVSVAYGPVRSIPTTYIIDKDLKVAKLYIGFRPKEVFEKDVKELLE